MHRRGEDWASALGSVLFATKGLGKAVRYNDTIEVNECVCKVPFAKMSLINSTNDVTFNPVPRSSRLVIFLY